MTGHSAALRSAIAEFRNPRGYVAVASTGLPPDRAVAALRADLDTWVAAERDSASYDAVIARTRASYARLVGVPVDRVAIGSQTSVLTSLVAAAVPEGAEVLLPDGDFASIEFPFLTRPGIRPRVVPLAALADAITEETWLVAFSHVQSATGVVADLDAIAEAAARAGAYTVCDVTQAAGVAPVDARRFDVTVCHAHKWLCSPPGAAFLTLSPRFDALLTPIHAGWYAGDDPWTNTYGPTMNLAPDARRFDVSPAWHAWVGAEHSIALFASLDIAEVWAWTSSLGDALCDAIGIPQQHQPIVSWPDASGDDLRRLADAGIRVSGRAGRLRASFHLWNDLSDVEAIARIVR
jgi:Selenocysteine lyase